MKRAWQKDDLDNAMACHLFLLFHLKKKAEQALESDQTNRRLAHSRQQNQGSRLEPNLKYCRKHV